MLGQRADQSNEDVADGFGRVFAGKMPEHDVTCGPFDEGDDRCLVARAEHQIALPMPWDSTVLNFRRAFADHHHRINEPAGALLRRAMRLTAGSAGAQRVSDLTFQPPRAWT